MRTRTIIAVFLALFITAGVTALWSAEGDEIDGDTATAVVAANSDGQAGADAAQPKKKGSRWGRFFKAPFKAVAKVFTGSGEGGGEGNGSGDRKLARTTDADAQAFESVGVMRVEYKQGGRRDSEGAGGTAEEHLERGRAHLDGGDFNEAVTELSRAVSLNPRLSQARSLLAVAYERKGLPDRAREEFRRAADIDDDDPQALNNLGYSLYVAGNYRAAVDKLKRAARLAPGDARVLNNLALAQTRLGKYDDAYKSFARAGGEFNARVNVAALLERNGREQDAVEHLERARRLQPTSAAILRRLADLYDRTGKPAEAQTARQALEVVEKADAVAAGGGQ
jgi:Flp pilus assembly protein TadD